MGPRAGVLLVRGGLNGGTCPRGQYTVFVCVYMYMYIND